MSAAYRVIAEYGKETVWDGTVTAKTEEDAHSKVYGMLADSGVGMTSVTVIGKIEVEQSSNADHYPLTQQDVIERAAELLADSAQHVKYTYLEDAQGIDDLMGEIGDQRRLAICGYLSRLIAEQDAEKIGHLATELRGYLHGAAAYQAALDVERECYG